MCEINDLALVINDSGQQIGTISPVIQAICMVKEIAYAILCQNYMKIF